MARIAEYKQIGTKQVEKIVTIPAEYNEQGEVVSEEHTETVLEDVAVMGMVYRDMTEQEEAEAQAMAQEQEETLPSAEERIEILEQAFAEFVEEMLQ